MKYSQRMCYFKGKTPTALGHTHMKGFKQKTAETSNKTINLKGTITWTPAIFNEL
jgi:hypothetical protein